MPPPEKGDPRVKRVSAETRSVVLSVTLSAILSTILTFAVAQWTAARVVESELRATERSRISDVYTPLSTAAAAVVSCIAPRLCSDSELFRANRAFNRAAVLATGQGSGPISNATSKLDKSLGLLARRRLRREPSDEVLERRAADDFVRLNKLIRTELSK